MTDLSILTITDYPDHAARFIADMERLADQLDAEFVEYDGTGAGVLEFVQDEAVATCGGDWVLLLADDERCTPRMVDWLATGEYRAADNWAFPRLNFWPDEQHVVMYPDVQTRLAIKAKSGGRVRLHQGSPFGTGVVVDVAIEHFKLLVTPVERRRAQLWERERMQAGAGLRFRPFIVPEDVPGLETVRVADLSVAAEGVTSG